MKSKINNVTAVIHHVWEVIIIGLIYGHFVMIVCTS